MKFDKKYEEYLQGQQGKRLPGVGFKKLKKMMKKCRRDLQSRNNMVLPHPDFSSSATTCPHNCSVCDGSFFPTLLTEMSAVVGCFNDRARNLLELHQASCVRKYYIWLKDKLQDNHISPSQEGEDLVTYAIINAIAMRKILKKFDKIHNSKQGQAFLSQSQRMHIEILQSPWLFELMALYINQRESKANTWKASLSFDGCSPTSNDCKPSLSSELFDSIKLDIDLTCSICLETLFDPVALTCGHIFCYMCACKSASVDIVDGLKAAEQRKKCPLCRNAGVYEGAVHLQEFNILLSKRCPEYWEQRLRAEREERIRQAKEHWESQCRAFVGV